MKSMPQSMFTAGVAALLFAAGAVVVQAQWIFDGDGSGEPGFVAPAKAEAPPPPPANIAAAESYIPYPGPPIVPQSRSEKKNPPNPPVMFVKLKSQYGLVDWASRPNDMNNLLKNMKEKIDVNFTVESKFLDEVSPNPEKNPILYRCGHFHFSFDEKERRKLREYLLNGGMLILNTGMGSKPFFDSAVKEMKEIFPDAPLQRLSSDHPIFHSYYDIGQVEYRKGVRDAGYRAGDPLFYGVTIDCRTVAVISRWCLAIGWDAIDDDAMMGYSIDSAQKLGINLMSYATAQRAWSKTATHAMKFVDQDQNKSGKVFLAQAIYDGEWKTRHVGLSVLLQQFNQRTDVPVKYGLQELKFTDPKIFDAPMIYITGHEAFQLSPQEVQGMRDYLKKGGFVMAEACCGRRGFDSAFQREMKKVLPEYALAPVPPDSQLFALPNQIKALGVTPALAAQLGGKMAVAPNLLGLDIDGHLGVIYSPYGMAGGWEMSQNPYAFGYDDAGALSLGENILMYAITH